LEPPHDRPTTQCYTIDKRWGVPPPASQWSSRRVEVDVVEAGARRRLPAVETRDADAAGGRAAVAGRRRSCITDARCGSALRLELEHRIGDVNGPTALTRIGGVAVADDLTMYVSQPTESWCA
jgi:hypothetical protein